MIVVYCLDENYIECTALSIKSVKKFNPQAKIVVVSEMPLNFWMEGVEKVTIPLPRQFRTRGANDRITQAAYLKCFLPQLPFDKIIYLDGDTICQGPLNELWEMPCDYINICESHNYGKRQAEELKQEKYGLTGMMVMNLANLRKIGFTETCLEVEKDYPTPPQTGWHHDETCINVACYGLMKFIDKKWDYCRNREYDEPIPEPRAKILHYLGKQKQDMQRIPHYRALEPILDDIRGKRVAIVGNAKSLFDDLKGVEIDTFDFVIRFNRGFITRPECQGTKTDFLILACLLTNDEIQSYNAKWVSNRSTSYVNPVYFTISNHDRRMLRDKLDSQPSTGFMAIDICLEAGAKSIDLFGFDFEQTPTFYNPEGYQTKHDYPMEKQIVLEYERCGLLTINPKTEQQNDKRNKI